MAEKPTYKELEKRVRELERAESERKQAEEALRESEVRFQLLYERVPLGYQSLDEDGNFIEVNPAWLEILGYSREEVIGKSFSEFLHPDWKDHFKENFLRFKAIGEILGVEFEMVRKDGSFIFVSFNGKIGKNKNGGFQQTHCILQDITKRKQAEMASQASEEKYRLLIEGVPDLIYSYSTIRGGIYYSPQVQSVLGYSPSDLVQNPKRWHDSIHPEDLNRVDTSIEEFKDGKAFEIDYRIKDAKGNWHWFLDRSIDRKHENGEIIIEGIATDITERKQAEEALKESETKFKDLVENINDVLYMVDDKGVVTYISPRIEPMMGYNPNEIIGKNFINYIHPDDVDLITKRLESLISGDIGPTEYRLISKSGKSVWIRSSSSLIFDGEVYKGLRGIFTDINKTRKIEEQLKQAQKMESIGNLAGGIAHDFNNILSSVIGYTELALEDAENGTLLKDDLQNIYTAGIRAKDLVKQILTFARQADEEIKPVQVRTIAKEALKLLRSSIPRSIEIRSNIEGNFLIMGNESQVQQIIMNLCTNSAQAMEEKGGILEVSLSDVHLDVQFTESHNILKPGTHLKITISDTGTGIPPDVIDSIFEPYFTTKGPGEGTGMGLALVHGIIKSYGGEIVVKSTVEKGTVFTVYLPAIKGREERKPYKPDQLPTGTERILFVDDEAPLANMGRQILERLGYNVTERTSSLEALELFRAKPNDFDLVITDMTMPNMTGDELSVELMKIRSGIPVILLTGYSKKINDQTASNIGIKAFAYKPIVKTDLAKTVRKVLDEATH